MSTDLRPWLGRLAAPRIARLPLPAETDDGNHWTTGRCWLWCGREHARVLWIGSGTAPGGVTTHLFACASCARHTTEPSRPPALRPHRGADAGAAL
ncbi:hypothetical protein [Streptomyces sp. HPF1205]|uniref:hypothetical protein n=1 Tax=Streptomyces sp. HPF1205 TaxID=2873262 RepID=UPI001CEE03DD|nr:hypothetical protein [Streptomyces sp. HPF1205]